MDYLQKSREILIMNLAIEKILKVDEWFEEKKNWIHEFCYLHITHSFTLYNLLEGSLSLQIYKLLALFVEQVEAIFGLYQL